MSSPVASPVKLTAMYNAHQELGAVFTHREGWRLPASYTSTGEEMDLARKAAGVCDISPVGKLDLQGDAVLDGLSSVLALQGSLKVGRVVRCPNPTASEDSGDAVKVAGLSYEEAMVVTWPGKRRRWRVLPGGAPRAAWWRRTAAGNPSRDAATG